MHGVFLDRDTLDRGDIDFTSLAATLAEWVFHDLTSEAQVAERIAQATVVVSNKIMLNAVALEHASALKLICVSATGTNNVDLDVARRLGITVCNVRTYATPSVVEHVFALILSLMRHLAAYSAAMAEGRWQRSSQFALLDFPITELKGKTLGIIGHGELGRAVAKLGEAFGMRVLIAARPTGESQSDHLPLRELLPQVDVLSLHVPLTVDTVDLLGAAELALMKPTALLINTARGGIVNEFALAEALRTGRLGGAGVDVLTSEPPREGHVLLEPEIPNLIVTPHIAWASREARQRLVHAVAANITAFLQGTPRNVVS